MTRWPSVNTAPTGATLLLLTLLSCSLLGSNQALASSDHPDRYQHFDVELLTIGPGPVYWERFGHNAILLRDRDTGGGITFNFGMFDFAQENFMLNFARGLMTYRVIKYHADADIEGYRNSNRAVWVQQLNLTREQKNRLIDHLNWHITPGNENYRYHYFDANCSTKVRDALDLALNGGLREHFSTLPGQTTQRGFVKQLTRPEPWLYTSTLLALGRSVDQPRDRWADFYVPMAMKDALADLRIANEQGREIPLVASTQQLYDGIRAPEQNSGKVPIVSLTFGMALAILISVCSRTKHWAGRLLPTLWLLVSGLSGLILMALWALTNHAPAYWNENLLLLNPLALLAAWGLLRKRHWSTAVLSLLAGLAVLAALLKLPGLLYQDNWEVIVATLPVLLALVWYARSERIPQTAVSSKGAATIMGLEQ